MFSLNIHGIDEKNSRLQGMTDVGATGHPDYDPALIKHLMSDHAARRDLLIRLDDHARHRQFAKIPCTLARLRDGLMRHIEKENEHFYAYLFRRAANDGDALKDL